jgi:hypothetical protein
VYQLSVFSMPGALPIEKCKCAQTLLCLIKYPSFAKWSILRLIDRLCVSLGPYSPNSPRPLLTGPLCPTTIYGSPAALPKSQMAPRLTFLISSGSRKEPRYTCLSKAKASHRQRIWANVSSCALHFLHNGPSIIPIKWRSLLRVLCLVRRPVTTLDCILLKDKSLALVPRKGPDINC